MNPDFKVSYVILLVLLLLAYVHINPHNMHRVCTLGTCHWILEYHNVITARLRF